MHRGMLLAVIWVVVLALMSGYTVGASTIQEERTLSGTLFPPPADVDGSALESVQAAAESWGYEKPTEVAFLYTDGGEAYLVGFTSEAKPGRYTLQGPSLSPAESESRYGVMIASSVEKHEPQRVDYTDLQSDPSDYRNQHVVTETNISSLTFRFDTEGISSQQTIGAIGGSGGQPGFLHAPGRVARYTLFNATSSEGASVIEARKYGITRTILASGGDSQVSFSHHERRFWTDTDGDMELLILPKDAPTDYTARIYYTTSVQPDGTRVDSVADIRSNPEAFKGETVFLNSSAVGSAVSAQESLLAVAECAPESVIVPASPPFCAPLPVDVVAHTGAIADESDPGKPVAYVGLSNTIQEEPVRVERGKYQIVGRVVDADKVAPRLDTPVAIVVMDRKRVGDLKLAGDNLAAADRLSGSIRRTIRSQMTLNSSEYEREVSAALATPTPTPTPTPTQTVTPEPTSTPTQQQAESPEGDGEAESTSTATPIKDYALYDLVAASIDKEGVAPGESVTATLTVRNPDPVETETTITVAFGVEEIEKEVRIPAESTRTVVFEYGSPQRRSGSFTVSLVRLTGGSYTIGSVEIVPRSTESPSPTTGGGPGFSAGLAALVVSTYCLLRYRR